MSQSIDFTQHFSHTALQIEGPKQKDQAKWTKSHNACHFNVVWNTRMWGFVYLSECVCVKMYVCVCRWWHCMLLEKPRNSTASQPRKAASQKTVNKSPLEFQLTSQLFLLLRFAFAIFSLLLFFPYHYPKEDTQLETPEGSSLKVLRKFACQNN